MYRVIFFDRFIFVFFVDYFIGVFFRFFYFFFYDFLDFDCLLVNCLCKFGVTAGDKIFFFIFLCWILLL